MRGGGGHLRLFRRGVRDGGGRLVLKDRISGRFIGYEDNVGREKKTNLIQSVGKSIFSTWCCAYDFPVIHNEFVSAGSGLPFGDFLQGTDNLNRRFDGQSQGLIRLGL